MTTDGTSPALRAVLAEKLGELVGLRADQLHLVPWRP